MTQTLQVEKQRAVQPIAPPRLLVEWSSPWHEFVTSISPALARSETRLAGEAPFGLIPYRILIPSYIVELFVILAVVAIQIKIDQMRPYVAPRLSSHDVIYYSGDELPRTEDLAGAEAGATGRAGGEEAHHRTQTIRIARGHSMVSKVVDAPHLKLPASSDAVANLLAISPNPGPPPSEGMRSNRTAPNLSSSIVAPAPTVARDYTRNGVQLNSVIPPAAAVSRDARMSAPHISADVIPPAPSVSDDHRLVAPALGPAVIPPAPNVARDRSQRGPSLATSVVAPAPSVSHDRTRLAPSVNAAVIPPAPGAVSRELSSSPVQMANVAVVPPPISSPERASSRDPKLSLPSPSVIAPPPSADVSRDMRRLASGSTPDSARTVVPPPPTQASSGSFLSSIVGKIFGASDVVPPPPAVSSSTARGGGAALSPNVVAPPPSVSASAAGGNPRGSRNGMGQSLGSNVIAPPPTAGVQGGTGSRSLANSSAPRQGLPDVVPPPPSLSGSGGGTGLNGGGAGAPGGTLLANNVVPPPPAIGGGNGSTGSGTGRRGEGLGGPMEVGAPNAPASGGASGNGAGAVISSDPGSKVGLPMSGGGGSLALSPSGGDKPGLGGSGGTTGIGHGNGPGSGVNGEGVGAGKSGVGRGADPNARDGISPGNGPGGAGNAPTGTPRVPGVSVSGGSSSVTLPSFGSDPAANDPTGPSRTPAKKQAGLNVTIVATANSGGAFEPYRNLLKGEKYTTYLDTAIGPVVMEFADQAATSHNFGGTLTAPTPIRDSLPEGLPKARMVVTTTLDASGNLRSYRVLESGSAEMTAKVLAALRTWKFQPAMRGNQPVEVTAIIGFNISTDDRF